VAAGRISDPAQMHQASGGERPAGQVPGASPPAPPHLPPSRPAPPPPPSSSARQRKLRFLALHGYGQTADMFRTRVGSLRKGLKSRAEFFFIDAPFPAAAVDERGGGGDDDDGGGSGGGSWWGWEGGRPAGLRPSQSDRPSTGWPDSRARILDALAEHAPVDGLLAFSQGAAAAGWLLAELGAGDAAFPAGVPPLRLAILAAGFVPGDPAVRAVFERGAGGGKTGGGTQTLFIAGAGDETVPPARTEELVAALGGLVRPAWLRHGGGHCLPTCSGAVKTEMIAFLDGVVAAEDGGGEA